MNERPLAGTLLEDAELRLPECLRWRSGRLYFSDMEAGRVLSAGLDGTWDVLAEVAATPCGLGWTPGGQLLIVSRHDRRVLRLAGGRLEPHADLSTVVASDLNDMVVDANGRAYVGSFGYDYLAGAEPAPAEIALVDADGAVSPAGNGVEFPNGLVVSEDGATLYVAETWIGRISAFRIGDDGRLHDRRVFANLASRQPDGMCLDAEGALWVGCPIQHETVRVLDGGRITDVVRTPGLHCLAPALGGDDGTTLMIGVSDSDFDPLQPTRVPSGPSIGWIAFAEVDVAGVERP